MAFNLLRIAGAVYLGWRDLILIRQSHGLRSMAVSGNTAVVVAVRDGLVASLNNPKGLIFMLAFLAQFVDPSAGSVARQMLILGVAMKLIAFAVEGTVAMVAVPWADWRAFRG